LNRPPVTYQLIHTFLVKRGHLQAALSVKQAAEGIVGFVNESLAEGPSLEDIVRTFQSLNVTSSKHGAAFWSGKSSLGVLVVLLRRYAADSRGWYRS
jgi:hypothetical protein